MLLCVAIVPALSFSLLSCDPENGGETIPPGVTPEVSVPDGYENYFIEDLSFDFLASEVKVAFQINVGWTMKVVTDDGSSASWCSVEPASGDAGLHKVTVRVAVNMSQEPRFAKIQLHSGKSKVAEIGVTQESLNYCIVNGVSFTMIPVKGGSYKLGLEVLKFFPAEQSGGLDKIKSLSAPFPMFKVMPTGGIGLKNLATYAASSVICACGGSYMVTADLIDNGKWDEITELCRKSVEIVKEARK